MAKTEIATEFIEKFRIKPSTKKKLEKMASEKFLKLNDFLRSKLEEIASSSK